VISILDGIDEVDYPVLQKILEINGILLEEATLPDAGKTILASFRP